MNLKINEALKFGLKEWMKDAATQKLMLAFFAIGLVYSLILNQLGFNYGTTPPTANIQAIFFFVITIVVFMLISFFIYALITRRALHQLKQKTTKFGVNEYISLVGGLILTIFIIALSLYNRKGLYVMIAGIIVSIVALVLGINPSTTQIGAGLGIIALIVWFIYLIIIFYNLIRSSFLMIPGFLALNGSIQQKTRKIFQLTEGRGWQLFLALAAVGIVSAIIQIILIFVGTGIGLMADPAQSLLYGLIYAVFFGLAIAFVALISHFYAAHLFLQLNKKK